MRWVAWIACMALLGCSTGGGAREGGDSRPPAESASSGEGGQGAGREPAQPPAKGQGDVPGAKAGVERAPVVEYHWHREAEPRQQGLWYCKIHASVTSMSPGTCPLCGMPLERMW